ncbi:hypothetical protein EXIGLDRAFT_357522 [Exidia glandulosa HHB12029]|uniref:Uncharacterized protein n=1 Tax=Exidia glandulosa HHB12029 TaxID=1314781 RepID=A0A165LA43_EXIGL|nr:hypothetical protein EXIGLDRAFT_357522 [Exidia glandulosa HHB12029]
MRAQNAPLVLHSIFLSSRRKLFFCATIVIPAYFSHRASFLLTRLQHALHRMRRRYRTRIDTLPRSLIHLHLPSFVARVMIRIPIA